MSARKSACAGWIVKLAAFSLDFRALAAFAGLTGPANGVNCHKHPGLPS